MVQVIELECSDPERQETFAIASQMSKAAVTVGEMIMGSGASRESIQAVVIAMAALMVSVIEDHGVPRAEIMRLIESDLAAVQNDYQAHLAQKRKEQN